MISGIIMLGSGLFFAYFLVNDYKQSWVASKSLLSKALPLFERVGGKKFIETRLNIKVQDKQQREAADKIKNIDNLVNEYRKKVGFLKGSLAELEANKEMIIKQIQEEELSIGSYEELIVEAMSHGKDDVARQAAVKKVSAEKRVDTLRGSLDFTEKSAKAISGQLQAKEDELDVLEDNASTIKVMNSAAQATEAMCELTGRISQGSGLTISGEVEELKKIAEKNIIKNNKLLEINEQSVKLDGVNIDKILHDKKIDRVLEDVQNKISLQAPQEKKSEGQVEIVETEELAG